MKPISLIPMFALALVLAACGKSSDNNSAPASSGTSTTTTTTSPPINPGPLPPTGPWCQSAIAADMSASSSQQGYATQISIGGQTVCKMIYNFPMNVIQSTSGSYTWNSGITVNGNDSITISSSGGPITYLNSYNSGYYIKAGARTFQFGASGVLVFGSSYTLKPFQIYNIKIERCYDTSNNIVSCY